MAPLPSLAAVPLEQLDAEFEARVRAAPRAEQDRLLSEADLLRAAAQDAHSWRALTIYRALNARLGDGTRAGLERAAWCCQEDPARDDVARRVAEVALGHPGEEERIEAERTLGQCDLVAGRVAEAEARLTALFARVRDRGDRLELNVCYALAVLYAWQRRELESLMYARRAQSVAERRPDLHVVHRAHALSVLSDAYRSLDDDERLLQVSARMLALASEFVEPDSSRVRRQAYTSAHEAAMLRGDLPKARESLEAARHEAALDMKTAGHTEDPLAYYEGRYALRTGNMERVGELLARHAERARSHATLWMLWALIEVEWLLRTGRAAEGVERAERALAHMQVPDVARRLGTGRRLRSAEHLAQLMEGPGGDGDVSLLAYREAADAAFDRLYELESCLADLPALVEPEPEDREALTSYRVRFVRRHRVVLDHLRERMAVARVEGRLPAWATAAAGNMTAVCAWCRSVRTAEGRWLPLGHFVPSTGPHLTVTHGICEDCRPRLGLG